MSKNKKEVIKKVKKPTKNQEKGMQDYLEKRGEEFSALEKEDLVNLALYFEHNLMIISSELQTIEHIEMEKEEILEEEDMSDDELEEKFQELSNYLAEQLLTFESINDNFDEAFETRASSTLKEFIKNFNNVDDKEQKH